MIQCKWKLNIGGKNMCQINYTTKKKKYEHITYAERTMMERWYNKDKKTNKEIAILLNKCERTIRREIQRGLTTIKDSQWRDVKNYSATIAEKQYRFNLTSKGPSMKLDADIKLVKHIEHEIKANKKSPEVIVVELYLFGFDLKITSKTIRNAIKQGTIFDITTKDLTYKKTYTNKNKEKRVSIKVPAEKSIEYRPKEANDRSAYGHWEGDCVIGKRKGSGPVLLTFTERVTREEIIIKIKARKSEHVVKAINTLERKLGKRFYNKFKSITFDNGSEFLDYKEIEKSCIRKTNRTSIYYAHPYCSGERGTNENANRMIRRWIPKGTDIRRITVEFIREIENWINNYPRKIFDYKSTNMILLEI
jgi:transposase, IS30 family